MALNRALEPHAPAVRGALKGGVKAFNQTVRGRGLQLFFAELKTGLADQRAELHGKASAP